MGWLERADVRDNTPWWLPDVETGGSIGLLVRRCNPFGFESGGPKHLEGGFYGVESLGPHLWQCKARGTARYRAVCQCDLQHKGQPCWLCPGHVRMIMARMSGVCPPCAHPPAEIEIQARMHAARQSARPGMSELELGAVEGQLWDLQLQLNQLVERGIVRRCRTVLVEVS